jgi:hypothetical protein
VICTPAGPRPLSYSRCWGRKPGTLPIRASGLLPKLLDDPNQFAANLNGYINHLYPLCTSGGGEGVIAYGMSETGWVEPGSWVNQEAEKSQAPTV